MKILCVLYDDPKGGMPKSYPLGDLPKLDKCEKLNLLVIDHDKKFKKINPIAVVMK